MNFFLRVLSKFKRSIYASVFLGIAPVVIILALNLFFKSFLQSYLPMTLFISAVVVSSWIGGIGPGLLATLLGALAECYFFIEPKYTFALTPHDRVRLTIYVLEGIIISLVFGEIRKFKRKISDSEKSLTRALAREKGARLATEEALKKLYVSQKQIEKDPAEIYSILLLRSKEKPLSLNLNRWVQCPF